MARKAAALEEARTLGLNTYNTGVPCKNGHLAPRRIGNRSCTACENALLKKSRTKNRESLTLYYHEYNKKYHASHKNRINQRRRNMKRLVREEAAARPRPELCELCGEPPGKKVLAWDHDHTTGDFRGWLCSNCNVAIGLAKENPTLLENMATYIRNGGIKSNTFTCEEV